MIKGFEEFTSSLSREEKEKVIPVVSKILSKCKGRSKAITNQGIQNILERKSISVKGAQIRKYINFIRVNNVIPCLVASSNGYYISDDKKEVKEYCDGLRNRATAISIVEKSIRKQSRKKF